MVFDSVCLLLHMHAIRLPDFTYTHGINRATLQAYESLKRNKRDKDGLTGPRRGRGQWWAILCHKSGFMYLIPNL